MKKIIYSKYDKTKIGGLPRAVFEGRIVVVTTEREAEKAVDYLLSQPILGIDTETRPAFKKGQINSVALLQVSSYDTCFLFRLNRMGMPATVVRLLEDKKVPKVGISLHDEMLALNRRTEFKQEAGYYIDLQKLYANFFGQKISKKEQLSNWEAVELTDSQKLYAATDAWSCIMLYDELMRLEQTGDYELIKVEEHVQEDTVKEG